MHVGTVNVSSYMPRLEDCQVKPHTRHDHRCSVCNGIGIIHDYTACRKCKATGLRPRFAARSRKTATISLPMHVAADLSLR